MATRPGKTAPGKRDSGQPSRAGNAGPNRQDESRIRPPARDRSVDHPAGGRPGPTFAEVALRQRPEREDGATGAVVHSTGPRRVLIFARTLKEACDIAKRKGYPRELWRFVTSPADTDVDPRGWATITVPGFQKDRPQAWSAYENFQAKCRGFGIRAPSYDP